MLSVAEFISEFQARRGRDLLVFACSGSKRSDEQIEGLCVKVYPSEVLPLCEDYRRCVARSHRAVTDPSSLEFAACLRYSGVFYQQIPLELWQELLGWPVLILSAYYGLIRPTDGIRHYDLSMNWVPKSCKRLLPSALSEYMMQERLERALLLTSVTYAEPFSDVKGPTSWSSTKAAGRSPEFSGRITTGWPGSWSRPSWKVASTLDHR